MNTTTWKRKAERLIIKGTTALNGSPSKDVSFSWGPVRRAVSPTGYKGMWATVVASAPGYRARTFGVSSDAAGNDMLCN